MEQFLLTFIAVFAAIAVSTLINRKLVPQILAAVGVSGRPVERIADAFVCSLIWILTFTAAFALIGSLGSPLSWFISWLLCFALAYFLPGSLK